MATRKSKKSKTTALILCIFLGYFGIHQFYVGKIGKGIVYLLTLGLFCIGWIVDIFLILSGKFRDSNGALLAADTPPSAAYTPEPSYTPQRSYTSPQNTYTPPQRPAPQPKRNNDTDIQIPARKDGIPRAYLYSVAFRLTNEPAMFDAAKNGRWELTAQECGDEVHLFTGSEDMGVLLERVDMLRDWLRRGDPYFLCIERITDTKATAKLAFYRDKRKAWENKEQTVVFLTGYKSGAKQDAIGLLSVGDEVDLAEDDEKDGHVNVIGYGDSIGSLPASAARRYCEHGAAGAFVESLDIDEKDDQDRIKPGIRIYW